MSAEARLSYQVHAGKGPYLALLHGFLSSSAQWMNNLEALADVCRPVTIELWGHGDSPAPDDETLYHPLAYVAQLEAIRQELGADRWCLCGYSLGAGLTIRYTHQHPERVLAHVFTNSSSGFADPRMVARWQRDADDGARRIRESGLAAIERIAVHPRHARRLPGDIYEALMRDAARLSPVGVAWTLKQTTPHAGVRDIAPANPRPALLAFGAHEKRFHDGKQWAETHMARLSVADLNAGHAVNMEDAAGFNAAVSEFILEHIS